MEAPLGQVILSTLSESLQALIPLAVVLIVVSLTLFRDTSKENLVTMAKGVGIAAVGLAVFLLGVKIGFVPYARAMGAVLASQHSSALLVVIGFAVGLAATVAEPAVRILASEVDEFSSGYLREKVVLYTIAVGVAVSVALHMVRIKYGIPLVYLVGPGYLLCLLLMLVSDSAFVAIAFDSGGVATGTMSVTFVMALAIGVASGTEGRDMAVEGFGLLSLVAMTPILTVLLLGFAYKPPWKGRKP